MAEPSETEATGLAPGDHVRIHTEDPSFEDVNGMTGRIVHCADPNVGTDAAGSDVLAHGCLVELDENARHPAAHRVWVTIDKLIRL